MLRKRIVAGAVLAGVFAVLGAAPAGATCRPGRISLNPPRVELPHCDPPPQ